MRKLFAITLSVLLCLVACNERHAETKQDWEAQRDKNILTVVTINSPNTYYVNSEKTYAGLEYDLAMQFGQYLGSPIEVKFVLANSIESALEKLESGEADIAAADLSITDARKKQVVFSTPYQQVQQQLVYNREITQHAPKKIEDLVGVSIVVPTATSFAERLEHISAKQSGMAWEARANVHSEALLEEVASGDLQYTVADSHLISVFQNFHPNLVAGLNIGDPEQIAWAFPQERKPELLQQANAFFAKIKQDGTLRNLLDRYHGNAKRLKPLDVTTFLARRNTLLPKYIKLFKQAQDVTGLDWRLLAAVSYQESHWDTFNTSPTNVRGLMMLTEGTADQMGVSDRLDPKQAIPAGAKYMNKLIDMVPERIPEPDRTFMALAAYNIGYAHVEDARILAQRLNMNPDSWADVKKTLVMLNDPKYYSNAKYGYCSGGAPVIYVESIRSYYNILSRYEPAHDNLIENFRIALAGAAATQTD